MGNDLIITVLGAGASYRCGYPLANNLFPKIMEWSANLGPRCTRLKQAIEYTIQRATELDCLTPDDLALQMHQRRTGSMQSYKEAWKTLNYARIATDAYFLSLESGVTLTQLSALKDYWHDAVGEYTDNWGRGFPATKHRLLSFNYDRLPERAFQMFFGQIANERLDFLGQQVLNTGLSPLSAYEIEPDRFCYLKLHGSVGLEPIPKESDLYHFGRRIKGYAPIIGKPIEVTDELYFGKLDAQDQLTRIPLIAFPSDKQRIMAEGQDAYFSEYVSALGTTLAEMFARAAEIRVVGYSFAAPDKKWLLDLIGKAPTGARLILHNPDALSIARKVQAYDKIGFTALPEPW